MANDVKFIFVLGTLFVCTWLFLMLPRNDTQRSAYGVTGENTGGEARRTAVMPGNGGELQMDSAPVVRDNTAEGARHRGGFDVFGAVRDTDMPELAPGSRSSRGLGGEPTVSPGPSRDAMPGRTSFTSYTVQKGDTLCKISRKFFHTDARWRRIYEANREVVPSPDVLAEGVVLRIPEP